MSDVLIGAGFSGMFYTAPKGTALPAYPSESLGADWQSVGAITSDGISLTLPSGDVIKNWALTAERKINTENGSVTAPVMYTNKKVMETLFGANNVSHTAATSVHGNVDSVEFAPDVSAEPASYLFLMKDGDKLAMLGTTDGLITEISDISFSPSDAVVWECKIDASWTFAIDDGQATS